MHSEEPIKTFLRSFDLQLAEMVLAAKKLGSWLVHFILLHKDVKSDYFEILKTSEF